MLSAVIVPLTSQDRLGRGPGVVWGAVLVDAEIDPGQLVRPHHPDAAGPERDDRGDVDQVDRGGPRRQARSERTSSCRCRACGVSQDPSVRHERDPHDAAESAAITAELPPPGKIVTGKSASSVKRTALASKVKRRTRMAWLSEGRDPPATV